MRTLPHIDDDRTPPLLRRLLAELLGSAFLAAFVVGSGIAAQQLSPGDVGLELFENAAATGAGLFAIILMVGLVSAYIGAAYFFTGSTASRTPRSRSGACSPTLSPGSRPHQYPHSPSPRSSAAFSRSA
jgi:hypothetical protein